MTFLFDLYLLRIKWGAIKPIEHRQEEEIFISSWGWLEWFKAAD